MAYPETLQDPSWYLDSGASNHVASDLGKLSLKGTRSFLQHVVVGNGEKLPITCMGTAYLNTKNGSLALKDILCVPLMKKNLISISKLTQDNLVSVEFSDSVCLVKERRSSEICLVGRLENGLYKVQPLTVASGRSKSGNNAAPVLDSLGATSVIKTTTRKDQNNLVNVVNYVFLSCTIDI